PMRARKPLPQAISPSRSPVQTAPRHGHLSNAIDARDRETDAARRRATKSTAALGERRQRRRRDLLDERRELRGVVHEQRRAALGVGFRGVAANAFRVQIAREPADADRLLDTEERAGARGQPLWQALE